MVNEGSCFLIASSLDVVSFGLEKENLLNLELASGFEGPTSISSSSLRMSIFSSFRGGLGSRISTLHLGGEGSKGPDSGGNDVKLELLITEVVEMLGGRTFFCLGGWVPTLKEGGKELRSDVPQKPVCTCVFASRLAIFGSSASLRASSFSSISIVRSSM